MTVDQRNLRSGAEAGGGAAPKGIFHELGVFEHRTSRRIPRGQAGDRLFMGGSELVG